MVALIDEAVVAKPIPEFAVNWPLIVLVLKYEAFTVLTIIELVKRTVVFREDVLIEFVLRFKVLIEDVNSCCVENDRNRIELRYPIEPRPMLVLVNEFVILLSVWSGCPSTYSWPDNDKSEVPPIDSVDVTIFEVLKEAFDKSIVVNEFMFVDCAFIELACKNKDEIDETETFRVLTKEVLIVFATMFADDIVEPIKDRATFTKLTVKLPVLTWLTAIESALILDTNRFVVFTWIELRFGVIIDIVEISFVFKVERFEKLLVMKVLVNRFGLDVAIVLTDSPISDGLRRLRDVNVLTTRIFLALIWMTDALTVSKDVNNVDLAFRTFVVRLFATTDEARMLVVESAMRKSEPYELI